MFYGSDESPQPVPEPDAAARAVRDLHRKWLDYSGRQRERISNEMERHDQQIRALIEEGDALDKKDEEWATVLAALPADPESSPAPRIRVLPRRPRREVLTDRILQLLREFPDGLGPVQITQMVPQDGDSPDPAEIHRVLSSLFGKYLVSIVNNRYRLSDPGAAPGV